MKNLVLIIIIGLSVVACESTRDTETIKKEITEKQSTIDELSEEIIGLKGEMTELAGDKAYAGKTIPVRTMSAAKEKFDHYFEATGEIESVNDAYISPEINGQVVSVDVVEGQKVKNGQRLAKLNTSLVEKSMQEVKTQLDFAKTMYDKQSDLWNRNIGSERQYLEAKNSYESLKDKYETLRTQYEMAIITAPFSGVVEDIMIKKGELAGPGMLLMQLVSLDKLLIKTKLSEAYLPSIEKGNTVEINFPAYSDLQIEADISRIGNVINKQNRTFIVEVELANFDNRLKPNMLANVTFNDYSGVDNFVVPSILIKKDLQGNYLYIVSKMDNLEIASKKYVVTGKSYKDKTEVYSGLETGEQIITDGYNNVSDGSVINLKN